MNSSDNERSREIELSILFPYLQGWVFMEATSFFNFRASPLSLAVQNTLQDILIIYTVKRCYMALYSADSGFYWVFSTLISI